MELEPTLPTLHPKNSQEVFLPQEFVLSAENLQKFSVVVPLKDMSRYPGVLGLFGDFPNVSHSAQHIKYLWLASGGVLKAVHETYVSS